MMRKPAFSALPRPIVTCILGEKTVDGTVATIKNGEFEGAPAFAVHLELLGVECLTDECFRRIAEATRKPIMFLHYRGTEKNPSPLTEDERVDVLRRAALCGASAVDITADTFDPSPLEFSQSPSAIDRQRRFIDQVHGIGAEVVISSHIYAPRTCGQVLEQMKAVEARGPDFAKIVTIADTEEAFLEAIKTTLALRREMRVPFIHLCGGQYALPHRYLSPSLGNALTFCVQRYTENYISVQPPLRNMMEVLDRWNWHIDDLARED